MAGPVDAEIWPSPCNSHSYQSAPAALARIAIFLPASTAVSPAGSITGRGGGDGAGVGSGVAVGGCVGVGSRVGVAVEVGDGPQSAKPIANSKTKTETRGNHRCVADSVLSFCVEVFMRPFLPLAEYFLVILGWGHLAPCGIQGMAPPRMTWGPISRPQTGCHPDRRQPPAD